MRERNLWAVLGTIAVLIMAGLLIACTTAGGKTAKEEPYVLESIQGTELNRLVLTEKAAERLDIQVAEAGDLVVPYAAVLYDTNGDTFVYTNPEPLTFVRAPIVVDYIEGDEAFLVDGPPAGTNVVIVGAAELVGIEFGVGK